jgi:putative copper resistance protein D
MIDAVSIAIRFLLYGELSILAGVTFFLAYALRASERLSGRHLSWRRPLFWLAVAGLVTSAIGLAAMTAQMTGSFGTALAPKHLLMVADTAFGQAWIVRMIALALAALLLVIHPWRIIPLTALITISGVALATLAWGGHALSFDGAKGTLHLAADVAHLLASGAWLGAIASLLALVFVPVRLATHAHVLLSSRALAAFSTVGTVLVGTILLTGAVNGWALVGVESLVLLPTSLYGQLLLAKLMLFAAMLILAAVNRFHLSPRLERAIEAGKADEAQAHMRRSLLAELCLALIILALVAVIGTLAPPAS